MSKLNSPFFIFHAVKEYFETGTLYAAKHFKLDKKGKFKGFDNLIHTKICVPATNIAFSLELAFKGLLMHSGKSKFGHDLLELYTLLDADLKSRIFVHYKSHNTYKDFITIRIIEGGGEAHGQIHQLFFSTADDNFIIEMLEAHKKAFSNFRYLYEFDENQQWIFSFKEFSNFTFFCNNYFRRNSKS